MEIFYPHHSEEDIYSTFSISEELQKESEELQKEMDDIASKMRMVMEITEELGLNNFGKR